MLKRGFWVSMTFSIALLASAGLGALEDNCANCHAQAPVGESHPPVEMSLSNCSMCHQATGQDPSFTAIHQKHQLDCSFCHGSDATPELAAKLEALLGE